MVGGVGGRVTVRQESGDERNTQKGGGLKGGFSQLHPVTYRWRSQLPATGPSMLLGTAAYQKNCPARPRPPFPPSPPISPALQMQISSHSGKAKTSHIKPSQICLVKCAQPPAAGSSPGLAAASIRTMAAEPAQPCTSNSSPPPRPPCSQGKRPWSPTAGTFPAPLLRPLPLSPLPCAASTDTHPGTYRWRVPWPCSCQHQSHGR